MGRYLTLGGIVLILVFTTSALCQEPIIYPAKGQGQSQMEQDKFQCYTWAKQQTGFDPMQAQGPAATTSASKSSPLRGAAGGAALGAAGGAIAGSAGKGAAIGAAGGGLVGGIRMRREKQQEASAQQAQAAAYSQERGGYDRAFGACMEGRGYTVK